MSRPEVLSYVPMPPIRVRERIGLLIHCEELLYHYGPLLAQLQPHEAELIRFAPGGDPGLERCLAKLPWRCEDAEELLAARIGYRLLLSNHVHGLRREGQQLPEGCERGSWDYLIRRLGVCNVRMMYGLGADSWNLAPWNQLYDAFLCHGPMQARQLARFRGQVFQMGYPRYDAYFSPGFDRTRWLARFGCDPARPVLVWFSTMARYYGVLARFAAPLSRLSGRYNLIVKPHPFSWQSEPDYVAALENLPFTAVLRESLDNLILFQLADTVIADYGGTAFSALYTDKPLLLLDHPGYPGQPDPQGGDSDLWLRQHLPHLGPDETDRLPAWLADRQRWSAQAPVRAWLRSQLFAPNYGSSAAVAAGLLRRILAANTGPAGLPH